MEGHDLIVMGASAGGIEALQDVLTQLPGDLPAAVCIVQHTASHSTGHLARILDRAGPLSAALAQDGESIEHGRVYIAPPDHHLLVKPGYVCVARGPRENSTRPAIDPLFRSAAASYGSRVIGVILTGLQSDGSSGLLAIKRCGGLALVQDPNDAMYPDMPLNALACVDVDYCLPLTKIGAVLHRLVYETPMHTLVVPTDIITEARIAESLASDINREETLGALAPVTCPECGGPLWELEADTVKRYRCHLGHAYTLQSLLDEQSEEIERALWTAVRTMEERAYMLLSMLGKGEKRWLSIGEQYKTQATQLQTYAQRIREILLSSQTESLASYRPQQELPNSEPVQIRGLGYASEPNGDQKSEGID